MLVVVVAAAAWATEVVVLVVLVAAAGCHLSRMSLRFGLPRDVPQEQNGPMRRSPGVQRVATSGRDPGVHPGQQGQLELALEGKLLWLLGALSLAGQPLGVL